jgi:hypothetical protein
MTKSIRFARALSPVFCCAAAAALIFASPAAPFARPVYAQDQAAPSEQAPPKVLQIFRESVKFGQDIAHMKNETAWAQAYAANKVSAHNLGLSTMSGADEAWFISGYDSWADYEKSTKEYQSAKYQPFMEKDAQYVSDSHGDIAEFNAEWSYRPVAYSGDMHYAEVEVIHVKPGHTAQWEEIAKMDVAATNKANIDEHDIAYDVDYGPNGHTVYIFTPHKSLADLDQGEANQKAFVAAIGDQRKHRLELIDQAIASASSQLLEVTPEYSYPDEAWIKADPAFWTMKKPASAKAAAGEKAPAAEKKSATPTGAN